MKTIELEPNQVHRGTLLLVNSEHPFYDSQMNGLVNADARTPDILIRRDAANILQLILQHILAKGQIIPVSGYRSAAEQTEIFKDSLRDNGEEFTRKYVAQPNHSEHQTGLAIDLGLNKGKIDFICPHFPYEGICERFRQTAPKHGFIERYAKEKESITGIGHEPWHFRYVGYPHSEIMVENQLAMEEYMEFIKKYTPEHPLVHEQKNGRKTWVYYVPQDKEKTVVAIPETTAYQVSGNNMDGYIVTLWGEQQ